MTEEIPKIEVPIIKTTSELKQSYMYLFARHLSSDGLPDDFSHLRQLIIAFLGDRDFYNILVKELEELDIRQKEVWGEKYNDMIKQHLLYNREIVLNSVQYFKKQYYMCDFVTTKIFEMDSRVQGEKPQTNNNEQAVSYNNTIKSQLKEILKELNLSLPVVNDCLSIAFTIIIKNSDLRHQSAPKEEIISPSKYKYDSDRKGRPELYHSDKQ